MLLAILLVVGMIMYVLVQTEDGQVSPGGDYVVYESAVVQEIISDSCESDEVAEGHSRGTQVITALVTSGEYDGATILMDNAVGPIYGQQLKVGDKFTAALSIYGNGDVRGAVYEYDRSGMVILLIIVFLTVTVLVGGKTGAKSIAGLVLTVAALLLVLIPMLLKGYATILSTFGICIWITLTAFLILGGCDRKTLCAMLGTISGLLLATLFGLLAQSLLRIDGYRQEYAEALLQLRQTGESRIGISGIIVAGVIVSSLGAVMDVAMSISSATQEIAAVGNRLSRKQLLKSAMNVGRDMVGTMTNTLILAIIGSSMMLIIYIASLGLPIRQFMSSAYLALEVISGLSSSIGVVLAVPLTALVSSLLFGKKVTETGI